MKTEDINTVINALVKDTAFKIVTENLKPLKGRLKGLESKLGRGLTDQEIAHIMGQVLQQAYNDLIKGRGRDTVIDGTGLVREIAIDDIKESDETNDKPN